MKAIIFSLFLVFNFVDSIGQVWAPIGAVWHYTKHKDLIPENAYTGFVKMESIRDTFYQGKQCKQIFETIDFSSNGISYYMYSDTNNRVFYYNNYYSQFCLLYDFDAAKGDSFLLPCNDSLIVKVDSISQITINGENYKMQLYKAENAISDDPGGWVIEGIGNLYSMFPTQDNSEIGPLRCYENAEIGLYKNPNSNYSCRSTTAIDDDFFEESEFLITPNPSNNIVTIIGDDLNNSIIINLLGETVEGDNIFTSKNKLIIDVRNLEKGIYIFKKRNGESKMLLIN